MTDQEPGGRMSAQSQSLYRKYRPRSFAQDELVGQEHVARTLQNAIELDRVAHAYLFCGPRGTGKTSTARLLAKAVNCQDPSPHNRPCNACAACRAINIGATVDIIEIDAASNRGVDDIRDLREKVKYAPAQLRVKFYIIDEAHQLTRDAFNAFLKTLEEPPPHVRFVLATTEADKLPDTVASRCQRFDFRRIPVAQAIERLRTVAQLEGLDVEEDALRLIARQATGSLRDALGLLDQLALFGESGDGKRTVTGDAVRAVLGLSRSDRLVGLVDALADRDPGAGLRLIAEAAETGEDVHQLNRQLVGYLRTLLHLRAGGRADDADETAHRQSGLFSLAELAGLVRTFSAIDGSLNKGSYAQLPLEIAFVEAIVGTPLPAERDGRPSPPPPAEPAPARAPSPSPVPPRPTPRSAAGRSIAEDQVRADVPAPGPVERPAAIARPQPQRVPSPGASSADLERLVAGWAQIKRDIKLGNSRIAALLGSVDPVAVNGAEVILVAPYEFHRNKINDDSVRRVVEGEISQHLGASYHVICLAPEEYVPSPAAAPGPEPEADQPHPLEPAVDAEPDENGPDPGDERRIRATKSIFEAEEIS
ncbi:DNA polymerase III subunit gamma/tau [Nitrolancea hollandica]|uniref:DNA polymerase III subunit gamma/tau n=1 Tax=Nitrolancea hollandica Lb TaxID=1129897 RepID=I4EMV2_9BACT|nr:DNA polymerase III subunit gamma/tau [Nitrolancea hollandica]CCF86015.1 DNA polymerase III, subunits gamma and tau [Nitrolancea hollandica Lb]